MDTLFSLTVAATVGAVVGAVFTLIRKGRNISQPRPELTDKQKQGMRRVSFWVSTLTFVVLSIGLLWTVYYLVVGALDAELSGYATNMSQLIVSVLTVFSILIAFYQFLREKP